MYTALKTHSHEPFRYVINTLNPGWIPQTTPSLLQNRFRALMQPFWFHWKFHWIMQRIPQFNLQAPAGAVCYYTTPVGIGTVAPNARQSFLSLMVVRHANVTSVFLLLLLLLLRHVPHNQPKLLKIKKNTSNTNRNTLDSFIGKQMEKRDPFVRWSTRTEQRVAGQGWELRREMRIHFHFSTCFPFFIVVTNRLVPIGMDKIFINSVIVRWEKGFPGTFEDYCTL